MDKKGLSIPLEEGFSEIEVFTSEKSTKIKRNLIDRTCSIRLEDGKEGLRLDYDPFLLAESPKGYIQSQKHRHRSYFDILSRELSLSYQEITSRFKGKEHLESRIEGYKTINLALEEGKTFLEGIPKEINEGLDKLTLESLNEWKELQENLCRICSRLVEESETKFKHKQEFDEKFYPAQGILVN